MACGEHRKARIQLLALDGRNAELAGGFQVTLFCLVHAEQHWYYSAAGGVLLHAQYFLIHVKDNLAPGSCFTDQDVLSAWCTHVAYRYMGQAAKDSPVNAETGLFLFKEPGPFNSILPGL